MKRILLAMLALFALQAHAANWRAEILTLKGPPLNHPFGIVRGPDKCLYLCEIDGPDAYRIDAAGNMTVIASGLKQPHELRFDKLGNLYIADTGNARIAKVDVKTKTVTTLNTTPLRSPISLQLDARGDVYVCEIGKHSIVKVDPKTGAVAPFLTEGLKGPRSIDFDRHGNLWIILREGHAVLKYEPATKKLLPVAGTGKKGNTGDGGPAKDATLSGPKGISVSPDGQRVFVADTENNTVRVIDIKTGKIELVWGTGKKGNAPDQLARPHALFAEADGSLLVSDSYNNRLLVLRPR
ncbi:MAG: hypothetical protein FJ395_01375 [Verrucomicrobia bacterium]|nr:hypothetical protein [Verrucomicrobiota bacterium]